MLTRRGFLGTLAAGITAAAVALKIPAKTPVATAADVGFPVLTYRGIPLVFDPQCQPTTVYFVNPKLVSYAPASR